MMKDSIVISRAWIHYYSAAHQLHEKEEKSSRMFHGECTGLDNGKRSQIQCK